MSSKKILLIAQKKLENIEPVQNYVHLYCLKITVITAVGRFDVIFGSSTKRFSSYVLKQKGSGHSTLKVILGKIEGTDGSIAPHTGACNLFR